MTETWNGVPVRYQLLTHGTRRYGERLRKGKPEFMVAHDTGNLDSTAQENVNYYENSHNVDWDSVASAHFFVDDKECIICIPTTEKAWHVLYNATQDNLWYGVDANDAAIGGEISFFTDRKRNNKSLDNGARVFAYLAEYWGIDFKTRMPGHQDIQSDKQDPGNVLAASGYGRSTSNLDKLVAKYFKKDFSEPKELQTEWKWKGVFTPNTAVKVRKAPSLKGTIVKNDIRTFTGSKSVNFISIVKEDGYWWLCFTHKNKKYYSAFCKITDAKERVKKEKYFGKLTWK